MLTKSTHQGLFMLTGIHLAAKGKDCRENVEGAPLICIERQSICCHWKAEQVLSLTFGINILPLKL